MLEQGRHSAAKPGQLAAVEMTAVEKMGETMLLRGDAELTEFGRGTGTAGSDVRTASMCCSSVTSMTEIVVPSTVLGKGFTKHHKSFVPR
ncbi:hypothetical protein [Rhodococcus wratislaviensis]|uniref:Uncharacterized protein n=1 Tax=Rhodococcus wratislaviensis TaxID=44752 RepID=A0AB38FFN4_RHOWR|nr:hypothetical protein [Rhodococcus wratislaviensis]SPZ40453.1 Uncharacterised protein [Rhodococcus wratislaviensis]